MTINRAATGKIATDRIASMSGSMEAAREMAKRDVPAGRLGTPEEYGDLVAFLCLGARGVRDRDDDPDRRRIAALRLTRA